MWSIPVVFASGRKGQYHSISDAIEALHILDGWWQKNDGVAFQEAINVCIAAIRDEASPEDARAAFVNALAEGGIRLLPAH